MATRLGTTQTTVQAWFAEKGRQSDPEIDSIAPLVLELGVSGHWLLTGVGTSAAPDHKATDPFEQARATVSFELRHRVLAAMVEALAPNDEAEDEPDVETIQRQFRQLAVTLGWLKAG